MPGETKPTWVSRYSPRTKNAWKSITWQWPQTRGANALLVGAEDHARNIGRAALELWVINDNDRALGVYKRSGFVDTEQVKRDESSGQIERRLLKQI